MLWQDLIKVSKYT